MSTHFTTLTLLHSLYYTPFTAGETYICLPLPLFLVGESDGRARGGGGGVEGSGVGKVKGGRGGEGEVAAQVCCWKLQAIFFYLIFVFFVFYLPPFFQRH